MTPTRLRVPWNWLSAVAAVWVVLSAWSTTHRSPTLEDCAIVLLALVAAIVPTRALESATPAAAEAAAIAGALAALSIATTAAGRVPPTTTLRVLHAIAAGEVLGLSTVLCTALPLRPDTLRRALIPGIIIGATASLGLWSPLGWVSWLPDASTLGPVSAAITVLLYAHAVRRPLAPIDRARLIAPGLGATALLATITASIVLGRRGSPLVLAVGLVAQVVGMTLGTGAIGLERAALMARRCAAGTFGIAVGTAFSLSLPAFAPAGAPIGTLAMLLVWPVAERNLRPDGGRLLDACTEIERNLSQANNLTSLASTVLDPLRMAARNLRAPAAFWVLDRRETLRIDVTGAAASAPLSLESERAILSWMRARPGIVFTNTLRPFEVRRPELRPVLAALDVHEAFAAVPLHDEEGEIAGVILLPRGDRMHAPSYEEESRLLDMARAVSGTLSLVSAMERAHTRESHALRQAAESEARRTALEVEHRVALERERGIRSMRAVGSLEETLIAYSAPMRAVVERIKSIATTSDPVAIVCEPGAGTVAVAKNIHTQSSVAEGPFAVLDASSIRSDDALVTLLGDQRTSQPRPGWLELAHNGTLVIEDLAALGHDAHVALLEVLRTGTARRVGAVDSYPCSVRLVLGSRVSVNTLDLPTELQARIKTSLVVPLLRNRLDDLESLALLAIDRACRAQSRSPVGIAPETLSALRAYPWPGNVRELMDVLDGAVTRTRGSRVMLDALPVHLRASVGYTVQTGDLEDEDFDYDDMPSGNA
jgi:transcriptional regulator with AAA-type ATPase domain